MIYMAAYRLPSDSWQQNYILLKLSSLLIVCYLQFCEIGDIGQHLLNQGNSNGLIYRMPGSITPVGMKYGKVVATSVPPHCCCSVLPYVAGRQASNFLMLHDSFYKQTQ